MKPRKILRESVRVALASFGQMILEEGAVWAARKVEQQKKRKGRRKRIMSYPAIAPLITEGAKYLEERWNHLLATRSASRARPGSRTRASADRDGAADDSDRRRKARRKK